MTGKAERAIEQLPDRYHLRVSSDVATIVFYCDLEACPQLLQSREVEQGWSAASAIKVHDRAEKPSVMEWPPIIGAVTSHGKHSTQQWRVRSKSQPRPPQLRTQKTD
jgi:hypothetical protein